MGHGSDGLHRRFHQQVCDKGLLFAELQPKAIATSPCDRRCDWPIAGDNESDGFLGLRRKTNTQLGAARRNVLDNAEHLVG